MADRVPASITIGGVLDADRYAELCDRIASEGLSIEWDGEAFEPHHRKIGEPFTLHALDVAWGRFDMLEAWCIAEHLPFVRWCGSYPSQWGAERIVFRGNGEPERDAADDDEQVIVGRERTKRLGSYAALIAYFDAADFEPPVLWVTGDPGTPVSNLADPPLPTDGHTAMLLLTKDAGSIDRQVTDAVARADYDVIVVGAGLRMLPAMAEQFETLINVLRVHAPASRLAFNSSPADSDAAARRRF